MLQNEGREREIQRKAARQERAGNRDFRDVLAEARVETECLHHLSIFINPCLLGALRF